MGRPLSPLKSEAIASAGSYLQRAIERRSDVFSKPAASVAGSFADLRRKLTAAGSNDRADMLNRWVAAHLTSEGRARMLTALRRRKADASKGDNGSKTIRMAAGAYNGLQSLAAKIGMPLATTLDNAIQVALADKKMQEMMVRLGVARSLNPRARTKPR